MTGWLEIPQAFYGSVSGESNFRILADSGDLDRDELDAIREHSNLGGTALTSEDPAPIYTAYRLPGDPGRWAFSRTSFHGARGRGNDYLAHVLLLDEPLLEALRGDLFVLADLGLFSDDKPSAAVIEPLAVESRELDARSARPLGTDVHFRVIELADLLRGVAGGVTALPTVAPAVGERLCRSVLSLLPPDDRRRLSFCSRFSHPRGISFRLVVFPPEDRALVERYLHGLQHVGLPAAPVAEHAFADWAKQVSGGLEPIVGVSLLDDPETTISEAHRLTEWLAGLAAPGSRVGVPATTVRLARLPPNRRLPRVGRLYLDAARRALFGAAALALKGEGDWEAVVVAASAGLAETPTGTLVAAALDAAPQPHGDVRALAVMAVLLATDDRAAITQVYGGPEASLWRSPAAAADALGELVRRQSTLACDLVTAWLRRWQATASPAEVAERFTAIFAAWHGDRAGLAVLLVAAERAAPPRPADARRHFLVALLRRAGEAAPPAFRGRLVLDEQLADLLAEAELAALAPLLVAHLAAPTMAALSQQSVPAGLLGQLLVTCERGLRLQRLRGEEWDVRQHRERWELASWVAAATAAAAAEPAVLGEVTWLVWHATRRLRSATDELATGEAMKRFVQALRRAVRAGADNGDVAARAAWSLHHLGFRNALAFGLEEARAFARRAPKDASRTTATRGWLRATRVRVRVLGGGGVDRRRAQAVAGGDLGG